MAKKDVGSAISWWGGKGSMAIRIISLFPKHTKYVEVFGGAGHTMYQKDKAQEEVYNDIHDGLISMWRVFQDTELAPELKRRLELTPMGRHEFDHCRDTWREETDPIEKARKFYVTVNQSFSSGLKNWKAMKGGKGVAKNTSKFYATINSRFDYVHDRLQNILIESMDYRDLIKKHDDKDVLFYIDPPYVGETRTLQKGYDHEMTDVSLHVILVDLLLKMKGKALLSGYDHPVYDRLIENGWTKIILGEYAKSSAYNAPGEKKTIGTEVLWVNYDVMTGKHINEVNPFADKEEVISNKLEEKLIVSLKDILSKIQLGNEINIDEEVTNTINYMKQYTFDVNKLPDDLLKEIKELKEDNEKVEKFFHVLKFTHEVFTHERRKEQLIEVLNELGIDKEEYLKFHKDVW